jgi:VCBS repeat-containing protein
VSPDLKMTDLVLVLRRDAGLQAVFDAFVSSQYDASSPNFHQWLTPEQVGVRFGPAAEDIGAISGWLTSHRLTVKAVSKDRMTIRFSGAAAQVQTAFHVDIHSVSMGGASHFANLQDPQIPAALGGVVSGVKALHNFYPRPQHRLGAKVSFDPQTGRWQKVSKEGGIDADSRDAHPDFGIKLGSGTNSVLIEDVAPYDFATIYNVLPAWKDGIDGTGRTIAIAGTSDINTEDVANFRSVFGLPAGTPPKTILANELDPGLCGTAGSSCLIDDLIENTLDVEWSGAVAKGADIVLVVSGQTPSTTDPVYSSADYVVENGVANILSVSYGECELGLGKAGNAAYNNLWETAATEGIAVFVAAGDSGAATCDQGYAPIHEALFGVSVSGMASTPYDTAVGGTDLNWGTKAAPYWNASNNSTNGSNALNYMPELPWNDTCTNPLVLPILQNWASQLSNAGYSATKPTDAESACNFVLQWWETIDAHTEPPVDLSWLVNTVGGGGGASNCVNGDGQSATSCSQGYPRPSWQAGVPGIPANTHRYVPDVSFFAGNGFMDSAYLICVSEVGTACVSSAAQTTEPVGQEVGGTSVGTPAMAGVMALIEQKAGGAQGSPNAELYSLASRQTYANCNSENGKTSNGCYFNDIDKGTIAMTCASGTPACTVKTSGDAAGVQTGYPGTVGFDGATGLGSLNVANVVNAWQSTLGTAEPTITIAPSLTTLRVNQALIVAVSMTGSAGTPTGTVFLKTAGSALTAGALSGGKFTFTVPANTFTGGTNTLTVSYGGDPNYALAKATAEVTVTKLASTMTVVADPTSVGSRTFALVITMTVAGAGPTPTGSVTASVAGTSVSSTPCELYQGYCVTQFQTYLLPNGTDTINMSYTGDDDYDSTTASVTAKVLVLTPAITAAPSKTQIKTIDGLAVTGTVTGTGPLPTGQVEIDSPEGLIGYATLDSSGSYTVTAPPGSFQGGANTVYATYSGDQVYYSVRTTFVVNATKVVPSMAVTPSATSVYTNAPLTLTGKVIGPSGAPAPWGAAAITVGGTRYWGSINDNHDNAYSIAIPAGALPVGTDTLTVQYDGNFMYTKASAATTVTVLQFTPATPVVVVVPASTAVDTGQALNVAVTVSGTSGMPTGSATLSSGSYASTPVTLAADGTASFTIPANTLPVGTDTLTATYSGDGSYATLAAAVTVTVNLSDFTVTSAPAPTVAAGQGTSTTLTVTTSTGYSGTVNLACSLTTSPANAVTAPTCELPTPQIVLQGGATTGSVQINLGTTARTTSMARPARFGWETTGGISFGLLVFFGVPKRRRVARFMLSILAIVLLLGSISACGGGGSGGGGGVPTGTTAGVYTFTVTATGSPAVTPVPSATVTLTVQ